jgi:hypothetical protein
MQCHRAKNCVPKSGPGQQATTESKTARVRHLLVTCLARDQLNSHLQAVLDGTVGIH